MTGYPAQNFNNIFNDLPFGDGMQVGIEENLGFDTMSYPQADSSETTGTDGRWPGKNRQGRRRGRPRIRTEEEGSANVGVSEALRYVPGTKQHERRKTQMRLAQRAYRARKEATVTSLNSRVRRLEIIVEQINTTFISFSDELIKSNVLKSAPNVTQKLHQSLKASLALTNQAISVVDDEHGDITPPTGDAGNTFLERGNKGKCSESIKPDSNNPSRPVPQEEGLEEPHPLSSYTTEALHPAKQTGNAPPLLLQNVYHTAISDTEGVGFAERLSRACAEMAYRALIDPAFDPVPSQQRFRFPLTVLTQQQLAMHFESIIRNGLQRGTPWELAIPFFSIGGAGLHYMDYRRDYLAHIPQQRSFVDVAESLDRATSDVWFDCYDVEGYLKEKGIIPVSDSPGALEFPLHPGSRNIQRRPLWGNLYQSTSLENIPLRATTQIDSVSVLSASCVCLGRVPGFRRAEVEHCVMELGG
ncbi:hypothetical protein BJX68DRAFT_274388 [Aspergillus pseudodeflectus]|uniref:BZIP domain-containing protein n=1 Tax=Aspergillus pseudodeflectus TaxID=176178 RepID=A0ABR4KTP8_9EURO